MSTVVVEVDIVLQGSKCVPSFVSGEQITVHNGKGPGDADKVKWIFVNKCEKTVDVCLERFRLNGKAKWPFWFGGLSERCKHLGNDETDSLTKRIRWRAKAGKHTYQVCVEAESQEKECEALLKLVPEINIED